MNAADLFGIGGAWTRSFRADPLAADRRTVADVPVASAVRINSAESDKAEVEAIRDRLRTAGTSLRDAVAQFTRTTSPVYTTYSAAGVSANALAAGSSARLDDTVVSYQVLAATQAVNTLSSTARSSSGSLGLDTTTAQSASSIISTAEMNTAVTTSYGSSTLNFAKGAQTSSSVGTLTGTYTGTGAAADATSLEVEITRGDTIGAILGLDEGDIAFRVKDQAGTVLFTYSGMLGNGEQVYLGDDIGLTIAFSSGQLKNQHTATTTVTRTPTDVDADAAFNAGTAPAFENGATVTAGAFTVNGTSITVNADDTINTVLSRINSSGAGVTASLSGDKVTIATTGNSEDSIVLAGDTSGFLTATKLAAATTTVGNVRDDLQVFSATTQFDDVVDGSFEVNGVSISVDKDTDSLSTVLARVNASGAGVTASYNSNNGKVTFTPDALGATLTLENDTSGFLAEALIAEGTETSHVDPDVAFNASPGFDAGLTVIDGSFTVNGVSISVSETDTINTVLARITASAADVTATYDADTDTVTLTAKQYGSDPITVGGDTSGFLAAVKLDGTAVNTTNPELVSALTSPLGVMAEYAAVTAGSLTVNGETIAIDPSVTTIVSLVEAIDALDDAGATVNMQTGEISIWSESSDGDLTLADTSGVLTALGIDTGSYSGDSGSGQWKTVQTGTVTVTNAPEVASDVAEALDVLNGLVTELMQARAGDASFAAGLEDALTDAVDLLRDAGVRGLSVDDAHDELSVEVSSDTLVTALNSLRNDADLERDVAGLVDALERGIAAAAGWDAPGGATAQTVRLEDTSRAQLTADQAQASLLYAKSSLQPLESEESTAKAAVKAYGG